ncbi:MAG: hypothetical protein M0R46_12430 [Candidatus Muirbacterium halophilum]|nr:hypothetical protein [Candidatus Muirbacterium halophilum]MCK9476723.1 hypothetical protein [Candidatus Muirbacterium halophilum]
MKKSLFSFLIFAMFISCFSFTIQNSRNSQSELVFKKRMKNFIQCKDSFDILKKTVDSYVVPNEKFAISSDLHIVIERSFEKYLSIQRELSRNWEDVINFRNRGIPQDVRGISQQDKVKFEAKLLGIGIVSKLLQYENSRYFYEKFEDNSVIRNKVNFLAKQSGSSFESLLAEWKSKYNPDTLIANCEKFEDIISNVNISQNDEELLYILQFMKNSEMLAKLSEQGFFKKWFSILGSVFSDDKDSLSSMFSSFKMKISRLFGNIAGGLKSDREPFVNADEIMPELYLKLQPGDILLEKAGFLLTDKFIPGHFGHVAIYSGQPKMLFNDLLRNYKDIISDKITYLAAKEGRNFSYYMTNDVIEALRPGTTLNPLEHFLKVDDVLVLRLKEEFFGEKLRTDGYIKNVLVESFKYLGTDYDFTFDVNSNDLIVCSELPYQVMKGIPFRVKEVAGSWSISPDDIAVGCGPGEERPFELVYFAHNGKKVKDNAFEKLVSLLEEEGSEYGNFPGAPVTRNAINIEEYSW